MNQQEYFDRFAEITASMLTLTKAKNTDYAGTADPFLNFKLCEKLGICSVEEGILVRMSDKLQRVVNLRDKKGMVLDEKIEDTLRDLSNYSIILLLYLESKNS